MGQGADNETGGLFMHLSTITSALVLASLSGYSHARIIHEDFDGPGFHSELNFDFGTDTDFAGFDTHDHIDGVLWMYADLASITVNSLGAGESIESISVSWTDFCGIGCTNFELFGATDNVLMSNTTVGSFETVMLSEGDLGEAITHFTISSFEGRMEGITIHIVPAPASIALLGLASVLVIPRRKQD